MTVTINGLVNWKHIPDTRTQRTRETVRSVVVCASARRISAHCEQLQNNKHDNALEWE